MVSSPTETLLHYFAYGSNMLWRRLCSAERAPSARPLTSGHVTGRRLKFDKVGQDGSGKCDAEPTGCEHHVVHGVIFEIDARDKPALDRIEGLGRGYRVRQLAITTPLGTLHAFAYLASLKEPGLLPFTWYRELVLAGAIENRLPGEYIERIRRVAVRRDPDRRRSAEHLALLGRKLQSAGKNA